ncbi:PREDICTED: uncharacterized protein LOC102007397 [Chinchilla lanigera]|uniref:uncharacterized protein LOC102007397 n=1 Tax=Chinchilla lanigera TaxID=34839 RepID=UPI00038ED3C0|nr:PREDICTED: uncharacterized protein LOC102007397 [Chinchilla lanigera]
MLDCTRVPVTAVCTRRRKTRRCGPAGNEGGCCGRELQAPEQNPPLGLPDGCRARLLSVFWDRVLVEAVAPCVPSSKCLQGPPPHTHTHTKLEDAEAVTQAVTAVPTAQHRARREPRGKLSTAEMPGPRHTGRMASTPRGSGCVCSTTPSLRTHMTINHAMHLTVSRAAQGSIFPQCRSIEGVAWAPPLGAREAKWGATPSAPAQADEDSGNQGVPGWLLLILKGGPAALRAHSFCGKEEHCMTLAAVVIFREQLVVTSTHPQDPGAAARPGVSSSGEVGNTGMAPCCRGDRAPSRKMELE